MQALAGRCVCPSLTSPEEPQRARASRSACIGGPGSGWGCGAAFLPWIYCPATEEPGWEDGGWRSRPQRTPASQCVAHTATRRSQVQGRGTGDQHGVSKAPRPQPFWPQDEDCRTHREKPGLTRGSRVTATTVRHTAAGLSPTGSAQTLRECTGSGWLLLSLHGPGLPCRAQPEMKWSFRVLGTVGLCLCGVQASGAEAQAVLPQTADRRALGQADAEKYPRRIGRTTGSPAGT